MSFSLKSIPTTQLIGYGLTLKKIISTNWIFPLTQPDIWNAKQAENQGQRLRPTKYIIGKSLNWKNPPNAQIVGVGVAWYMGCVKLSTKSGGKTKTACHADFRFTQLSAHRWLFDKKVLYFDVSRQSSLTFEMVWCLVRIAHSGSLRLSLWLIMALCGSSP